MKKKPTIALFLHHPICSVDCVSGIREALYEKYNVKCYTADDIRPSLLHKTKIICFPGGEGEATKFDTLLGPHIDFFKEFLDKRGKYLGVCMGAYWAGARYFNILRNLDLVQYIKRRKAEIRRSHPTTIDVYWNDSKYRMYFYDGCAVVGNGRHEVVGSYMNGDAMAIIQNNVGIIGCHPESMKSWYEKPYLQEYWHRGLHHKLLAEFTDELMER